MNKIISTLIWLPARGRRMKSDLVKVLHPLRGKTPADLFTGFSQGRRVEKNCCRGRSSGGSCQGKIKNQSLFFVEQVQQLGTGHAVLQAKDHFDGYRGTILILCGMSLSKGFDGSTLHRTSF